jgi:uroporphyrinogen-III synthase
LANAWLVFFAPSAARAVLPTARRHFELRKSTDHTSDAGIDAEQARHNLGEGSPEEAHTNVRIAAIGPTTATYLQTDARLFVDFVPEKPGPVELAHGIANVISGAFI